MNVFYAINVQTKALGKYQQDVEKKSKLVKTKKVLKEYNKYV